MFHLIAIEFILAAAFHTWIFLFVKFVLFNGTFSSSDNNTNLQWALLGTNVVSNCFFACFDCILLYLFHLNIRINYYHRLWLQYMFYMVPSFISVWYLFFSNTPEQLYLCLLLILTSLVINISIYIFSNDLFIRIQRRMSVRNVAKDDYDPL
jgi:hypothetical protein